MRNDNEATDMVELALVCAEVLRLAAESGGRYINPKFADELGIPVREG